MLVLWIVFWSSVWTCYYLSQCAPWTRAALCWVNKGPSTVQQRLELQQTNLRVNYQHLPTTVLIRTEQGAMLWETKIIACCMQHLRLVLKNGTGVHFWGTPQFQNHNTWSGEIWQKGRQCWKLYLQEKYLLK